MMTTKVVIKFSSNSNEGAVMVFLDERYLWNKYYRCFLHDWGIKVESKPMDALKGFFLTREKSQ